MRRTGSQQGQALSWVDLSRQGGQWWPRPEKKPAELFRHKPKAGTSPGIAGLLAPCLTACCCLQLGIELGGDPSRDPPMLPACGQ